ncbi:Nucleolar pre-ribosomal-associated protein 1 [Frankliniella fusca]|uniref:Nucleolar pre-ribosomal-associated protein 1 n=1 Tax=Frankliniella fusca TaxID=407009 RepID=A0AAE1GQP9_9NEOP|nr:Nucleolar pre-ribosomal-associated protein 1 [Frankliniella fusca]
MTARPHLARPSRESPTVSSCLLFTCSRTGIMKKCVLVIAINYQKVLPHFMMSLTCEDNILGSTLGVTY